MSLMYRPVEHSDANGMSLSSTRKKMNDWINDWSYLFLLISTVLNELDGLCRSRLATEARAALAFLREKNPQIRYVTSKGAPLPNFAACTMNEESDDQVLGNYTWDDLIRQQ